MSRADEGRLIHLAKKREREKEDIEKQLRKLEEDKAKCKVGITNKFTANYETVEETLKAKTYGLVSLDDMKNLQKDAISNRDLQVARGDTGNTEKSKDSQEARQKEEHVQKHTQKRVLSFAFDEEDEEDGAPVIQKKRVGMDPTVDTSFLPDKDREEMIRRKKEELAAEWREKQETEKNEEITVACAYWDGSSHRKNIKVKKGNTISQCLSRAIEALKKEFTELKSCTPENLMFVKEDLIIPHFYTFQDFIVTKAMGKTGPLFVFDAASDVRIRQDAALDYGESHPAKIVLRTWYEKNKHIYPASRWEPFVPSKKYGRNFDDLSDL
ncbi:unnamed protein product [Caenorhabditis sp. 36 PRJEB53466]|nr:unnamed protein product [Caenorhabditis sp. 36 PRJEB53466]